VTIKETLGKSIEKVLLGLGIEVHGIILEHPQDSSLGDYATNVALLYAKKAGKNPKELAEEIVSLLNKQKLDSVEEIEIAGIGFINFYLTRELFTENLKKINQDYGKNKLLSGKKVMVEYTDPNPFKEFHIGHLMSNAIGESISRLVEFSGAEVKRACYQGDVGMHVATAIHGLLRQGDYHFSDVESSGKAYTLSAMMAGEYDDVKGEIKEINKKIYDRSDSKINTLYIEGRSKSLEYFELLYKKLGTKFDFYFFESESGPVGVEIVKKHKEVFEESEGAVIYKGEKVGLHTRVFITKEDLPTYESKELGLAEIKDKKYPSDISIVVTGNEVKDYYRVVRAAMKEIKELADYEQEIVHIPHGMLRLPSGKMSSRTGDVITAEELLTSVEEKLLNKIPKEHSELLNDVAVAAVKYSMLKQEAGKDIIFDFDKSISFTGDSGPYLQYTHARCKSVIEKGEVEKIKASTKNPSSAMLEIERKLHEFPEVVERAGKEYAPHRVCTYLYQLASAYNTFYNNTKIVDASDNESPYKLAVTEAVAQTLANGLYLLGIKAPNKM